eukprot:CAMPEP_0170459448 /NCGR_PEP_ID=MMETSP0123-20130129/6134_1 /TAXON_ID=182087 /ORGANISM="Favella ehrenbergii, Strain Fehren 1" /LENGTH=50 /DNA_ID=CAMNT_0010724039 /DNA_START=731 /DNA_END=883 /DNA_ORIENTATION=+
MTMSKQVGLNETLIDEEATKTQEPIISTMSIDTKDLSPMRPIAFAAETDD